MVAIPYESVRPLAFPKASHNGRRKRLFLPEEPTLHHASGCSWTSLHRVALRCSEGSAAVRQGPVPADYLARDSDLTVLLSRPGESTKKRGPTSPRGPAPPVRFQISVAAYFRVSLMLIILNSSPLLGSLPNISSVRLSGPVIVSTSRIVTGFLVMGQLAV